MNIFSSLKNNSMKLLANNFLNAYGAEIIDLSIDKENKTISATIALDGEGSPVCITLNGVNIISKDKTSFLSFKTVTVDREWIGTAINTLLKRYVPENQIEIPRKFSGIIKMLL